MKLFEVARDTRLSWKLGYGYALPPQYPPRSVEEVYERLAPTEWYYAIILPTFSPPQKTRRKMCRFDAVAAPDGRNRQLNRCNRRTRQASFFVQSAASVRHRGPLRPS